MKTRALHLTNDPRFFLYENEEDFQHMNIIELTARLKLVRKELRNLTEKTMVRGSYYRKNADTLDIENQKKAARTRELLEQLLFDKQGYVPKMITDTQIRTLINQHNSFMDRLK